MATRTVGASRVLGAGSVGAATPTGPQPKSMNRPKHWSEEVEDAYRLQLAGYRDEIEYRANRGVEEIERWPETGFIKKLQRKDGYFYYFNRARECPDKEVNKCKLYAY